MVPWLSGSPREALGWVEQGEPFDVALLDMQMPEMDGLALAGEVRRLRDVKSLPIVLLSSLGRRETGVEGIGLAGFLTKPVKASQLFNALVGIFGQEAARRAEAVGTSQFDGQMGERWPLRILLAEDNAVNQKLALQLLRRMGYRADVAADGLEALAALQRQVYDVVLIDVQMPEMDGLQASRAIVAEWPRERRPRLVAMTANAMAEDRAECLAAGMDDHLAKPIRVEELALALGRCQPLAESAAKAEAEGEPAGGRVGEAVGKAVQAEPAPATLDPAALARLREMAGDDEAFLSEMIDTFLADAPGMLAEMRGALERGDAATLRRAAHSLKSNSRDFGAQELSALCLELETMGKAGALEGAAEKPTQVEAEYARVAVALRHGT